MKFTAVEHAVVYITIQMQVFLLKYCITTSPFPLGSSGYYDSLGFLYLAHFCIYPTVSRTPFV